MSGEFCIGLAASLCAMLIGKYISYLWTHRNPANDKQSDDVKSQAYFNSVKLEFLIAFPLTIICLLIIAFFYGMLNEVLSTFLFIITFFGFILTWSAFYCLIEIIKALKEQPTTKTTNKKITHKQ